MVRPSAVSESAQNDEQEQHHEHKLDGAHGTSRSQVRLAELRPVTLTCATARLPHFLRAPSSRLALWKAVPLIARLDGRLPAWETACASEDSD